MITQEILAGWSHDVTCLLWKTRSEPGAVVKDLSWLRSSGENIKVLLLATNEKAFNLWQCMTD